MQDIAELTRLAKCEIQNNLYITIATVCKNGKPWNSPVYTAYDDVYNFYWVSDLENIHSQNIRENNAVFGVIFNSSVPEGTGFGVYLEGNAEKISEDDTALLEKASSLLAQRKFKKPRNIEEYLSPNPRRIFKFIPQRIYVNIDDERDGSYVDNRVEITQQLLSK